MCVFIYIYIYVCIYIYIYIYMHIVRRHWKSIRKQRVYTRSPLQDSRLFGPSPWKILATSYEQQDF